jgi:hypothetical protein
LPEIRNPAWRSAAIGGQILYANRFAGRGDARDFQFVVGKSNFVEFSIDA